MEKFFKGFIFGYLGMEGKKMATTKANKSHSKILANKPVKKNWGG